MIFCIHISEPLRPPKADFDPFISPASEARLGELILPDVGKHLARSTALGACPELVERGRLKVGG
ncbi:MAG: hypothetical protein ACYTDV_12185 [Planctomycetota bacterium]